MLDDISRSTDEVLNRQKTIEEPSEGRERRPSGHKRSRSDGSRTAHAITLTTGSAEEQQKGSMTTAPQQMKRGRVLSSPYIARPHKGDVIYCTYLCVIYVQSGTHWSQTTTCTYIEPWNISYSTSPAVETTSCVEGLKRLLDYKQREYAEGTFLNWYTCIGCSNDV